MAVAVAAAAAPAVARLARSAGDRFLSAAVRKYLSPADI